MELELNLEKSVESLKLSLEKAGIATPPAAEVGFGLDVSYSFKDEHGDGITDQLLSRLVPWGLVFDPDKKVDAFTFSDGAAHVQDVGPVTADNYLGFIKKNVVGKVVGWNGGTTYADVIHAMLDNFGWVPKTEVTVVKKAGFFGRILGEKDQVATKTVEGAKKPSLVFIVTDGDNQDKAQTRRVLAESEARGDKVYFIFIGVSNQGSTFPFLERIGDEFSNTSFVAIPNLRQFVQLSDDELNAQLISDELLAWLSANG